MIVKELRPLTDFSDNFVKFRESTHFHMSRILQVTHKQRKENLIRSVNLSFNKDLGIFCRKHYIMKPDATWNF